MKCQASWWPDLPALAAGLAGCTPGVASELLAAGEVRLDCPHLGSSLNNDGTPVELGVSVAPGRRSVRLLMDPAHWEPDALRRYRRATAACERFRAWLPPHTATAFDRALKQALPGEDALLGWLPSGALWLGTDLKRHGIAVYVSARWGAPAERWPRIFAWLDGLSISAGDRLAAVTRWTDPASVSLAAASDLRARVYFRLREPRALAELELPLATDPALEYFLAAVIGDRSVRRSGLLVSVSSPVGAARYGAKLDVCAHCVPRSAPEWVALIEDLSRQFRLPSPEIGPLLMAGRAEMAFIGFGFPTGGSYQLNCYLKAPETTGG